MTELPLTCLNGEFIAAASAALPITDRATRFGDGVFETMRLVNGIPYQWAWHLARLSAGLSALRITPPAVEWDAVARELIGRNSATDGFLRISITRGSGSRGYAPLPGIIPNWAMECLPQTTVPDRPSRLWLSPYPRIPLACLPVNSKLSQGLNNALAIMDASEGGYDEALQLTTDGMLCELAGANLFWLKGDRLFTPALETGCLNGSTRAAILRLSPVAVEEIVVPLSDLQAADAVFYTNCRVGVKPVASLAPQGCNFNTDHPLLKTLTTALATDRAHDTEHTRQQWASQ